MGKQIVFPVVIIIIHCEEIYMPCVNKIQCCIVKHIKPIYGLILSTLTCADRSNIVVIAGTSLQFPVLMISHGQTKVIAIAQVHCNPAKQILGHI